jgi:high-affinity nickel-transport protein
MEQLTFLSIAFLLGFRHGVDWDHIAALSDIVGTSADRQHTRGALFLSLLYALGHALVVVLLGVAALAFAAVLPNWIDPIMERFVGITLLILGVYVVVSIFQNLRQHSAFHMQSRWMLLGRLLGKLVRRVSKGDPAVQSASCGPRSAFAIGMLHGIGAETGTQVLLLAAIGGQHDLTRGLGMLLAFVGGLVTSNTAVAGAALGGIRHSKKVRPVYLFTCSVVAIFSLIVGTFFVLGRADSLPDLQIAFHTH